MAKLGHGELIGWIWRMPFGLGRVGVMLFLLGFVALVVGAVKEWMAVGSGMAIVAVGLASISVGIGFISVEAAYKSDTQMKAMANLEVREKIAMIYSYMGKQQERIDWDRKAAFELKDWVEPELWKKFEEAQQNYREFIEQNRSEE